jgi:hypothetical protein
MEHRRVIPDLPELPQLPMQLGDPTPAAKQPPAEAAGSAAQLFLQELQKVMKPPPQPQRLLELPGFPEYDEEEGYEEEDEDWDQGLDTFVGDSYENQELDYFQLHPHLLLAAQEAVQTAAVAAKAKVEATKPDGGIMVVDAEEDGAHVDLLEEHIDQYADPQGAPVIAKLAVHIANIWGKG